MLEFKGHLQHTLGLEVTSMFRSRGAKERAAGRAGIHLCSTGEVVVRQFDILTRTAYRTRNDQRCQVKPLGST